MKSSERGNDRYPRRAGHRGNRDTSIAAADDIQEHLGKLQAKVHDVVSDAGVQGATSDEIGAALDWIVYRVRPRTAELRRMGRVVDSGLRRPGASGRSTIVWTLPEYKQDAA